MLIRVFRSNQPYTALFVPVVAAVLCLPLILKPAVSPYFTELPATWRIQAILAWLLMSLGGVLMNQVVNREEFSGETTHLPSLWYLMLCGPALGSEKFIPVLFANLFLLFGLRRLLSVFRQPRVLGPYFEAGFWTGIASVIHYPYLLVFPAIILGILYTRTFNFREVMMPLLGGSISWIYLGAYHFLFDKGGIHVNFLDRPTPGIELLSEMSGTQWLAAILLLPALIHGIWHYLGSFGRSTNRSRNTKSVFLIWSIGLIPAALFLLSLQALGALSVAALSFGVIFSFGSFRRRNDLAGILIGWMWVLYNGFLIYSRLGL